MSEDAADSPSSPVLHRTLCYTTLLTTDSFLPGVQALLKSLYTNVPCVSRLPSDLHFFSSVHVVVFVTANVSKTTIRQIKKCGASVQVKVVDSVPAPPPAGALAAAAAAAAPSSPPSSSASSSSASSSDSNNWDQTYTKLSVFNPSNYSDVFVPSPSSSLLSFYIDADCLVLQDPTYYAQVASLRQTSPSSPPSGLLGAAPDVFPPDRFNAGVLLLSPSLPVYSSMLRCLSSGVGTSYDGGDTGFLNWYYPHWFADEERRYMRLPFRCNAQRIMHWFTHEKRPGYWLSLGMAPRRRVDGEKDGDDDDEGKEDKEEEDKEGKRRAAAGMDAAEPVAGIVILHYSSTPKPWAETKRKGELEIFWWDWFTRALMG